MLDLMRRVGAFGALAAGIAGCAALLLTTAPPAAVAATLRHPIAAAAVGGPEALAVSVAVTASWLGLAWLALAVAVTAAAALPGRCGHLATDVAAAAVPATLRRLLALALGAAIVTGTAGPAWAGPTTTASPSPAAHPGGNVALVAPPDLDWPATRPAPVGQAAPAPRPAVGVRPQLPAASAGSPAGSVVVRHGDSLWSIARNHLAPGATNAQIAAAWPRWYAANRSVVGPAPDLLVPGQRLIAPTPPSGGSS